MEKQEWLRKHEKAAAAAFCAAVVGITGITGYHLQEVQAKTYGWTESSETGTDETQEDWKEHVREIQVHIEGMEKYHVSYDEKADAVYYDGRKVRNLVDERADGSQKCLYDEEGVIDVHTERDSDGNLVGIRVVREKDAGDTKGVGESAKSGEISYDIEEPAAIISWTAKDGAYEDDMIYSYDPEGENDSAAEYTYTTKDTSVAAESAATEKYEEQKMKEDMVVTPKEGTAAETVEDTQVISGKSRAFDTAEAVSEGADDSYDQDNEFYSSLGLTWDRDGYWTYHDKKVKIIWVEDGSFSTWGNVEEEDSICLHITKESIQGVISFHIEEMTFEELKELYSESHPGRFPLN